MDKSKTELKVGIFVFVAVVILGVLILKIGGLKSYRTGYPIRFIFNYASGVKSGSPIRFSGVDIGEVIRVDVVVDEQGKDMSIEIVARIKKSLLIPQNSKAYINTLGLLGEKYIEVVPPDEEYKSFLKPGDSLIGTDPVMMQYWIDEAQTIVKDFQALLNKVKSGEGTIGKLVYEDKLYQELESLITDIRQAKEGTIGKLLYDDSLYQELEALISDIRRHPWKLFWKTKEKKKK